jgi:hypothetical protein
MGNMGRKWKSDDERFLIYYWGNKPTEWIAEKLGRTVTACSKRMTVLTGSRSITRGKWTQRRLALECGFLVPQIKWAVDKLGLKVKQPPKKGRDRKAKKRRPWDNSVWLIDDDQADKIIYWLTRPRWERTNTYTGCTVCESTEREHKAKGVCTRCYSRLRAQRKQQKDAA